MLIRWQKYISKGGSYRGKTTRVRAILSKSLSVDGKSRQRYVAFVGSFVAERLDVEARHDFWKAARERLSLYAPDDDRSRIEAVLGAACAAADGRGGSRLATADRWPDAMCATAGDGDAVAVVVVVAT
jgi:hypothetical protein